MGTYQAENVYVETKLDGLIKQLSEEKDYEAMRTLLGQIKELKEIKIVLAKALGERVVLK